MRPLIAYSHADAEESQAGTHRWMVSYADFITLMFVFFLALYAMLPKTAQEDVLEKVEPQMAKALEADRNKLLTELEASLAGLLNTGTVLATRVPEGVLLEINEAALFSSGTATPENTAASVLAQIAQTLSTKPYRIQVEGHTDSQPVSTAVFASNWELSAARAAAVVRLLNSFGIEATRLNASGYGDTRPKMANDTPQGRAANRRVSLLVLV